MIYADCGVVVDPDVNELSEIAIASADSCRALLETEPRVAMLSFSTKGSAKHKIIDKISEGMQRFPAFPAAPTPLPTDREANPA